MLRSTCISVAAGITVAVSSVAHATAVPAIALPGGMALNVQQIVGSGANTSYEVIDFADTGGPSFAWEYKYNTPVTGYQMLQDIAAADPNLTVSASFYAPLNEFFVDNLSYTNSYVGNVNDFWRYVNGTYASGTQSVNWVDSDSGAGDTMISDGSFDGWYNSFDVDTPPALPQTALPEPKTFGEILMLGSICLLSVRKRRPALAASR